MNKLREKKNTTNKQTDKQANNKTDQKRNPIIQLKQNSHDKMFFITGDSFA